MKNQICCWKQIKRTFKGGFTFMRRIYHASNKKHNVNSIPSFEFQNMQFYDKENFKKKLYLIKIQFSFEFQKEKKNQYLMKI